MTHHAAAALTVNLLAAGAAVRRRLAPEEGQGTVEYVGLILLVAGVLAAVVVWARSKAGDQQIGRKVTEQLREAIDQTAGAKK
jgi:ABC-type transport system involved in cytochrome bd biosynthesis fused ATPase/permease subunit